MSASGRLWELYRRQAEFGVAYTPDDLWIRPDPSIRSLADLYEYALTFDGYVYARLFLGSDCAALGNAVWERHRAQPAAADRWDATYADLRCTMFWTQRSQRWAGDTTEMQEPGLSRDMKALLDAAGQVWETECPGDLRDAARVAEEASPGMGAELHWLSDDHRRALEWFARNKGQYVSWPDELPGGIILATRAKRIYEPAWSEYALSIRGVFKGPHADGKMHARIDGSWTLEFTQEGHGDEARVRFTNRALVRCAEDRVPIGVFVQHSPEDSRVELPYEVAGLALVRDWVGETFVLDEYRGGGAAARPLA
jgi:hypothetical protein